MLNLITKVSYQSLGILAKLLNALSETNIKKCQKYLSRPFSEQPSPASLNSSYTRNAIEEREESKYSKKRRNSRGFCNANTGPIKLPAKPPVQKTHSFNRRPYALFWFVSG